MALEEIQVKNLTVMFGARIRELRKNRGMTQDQLAEYLGIEQKHVSLIEHGKSYPSLDRLERISEALQVPLPSLFDFMHMEEPKEQALSIEEVLKRFDEKSRRKAYKIIQAVLKGMEEE